MKLRSVLGSLAVLVAVGATGVAAVAVVPAQAADPINREYKVTSKELGGEGDGYAKVRGDLTWYDKSKFIVSGRVNDICPGDGYGAYFRIHIWYKRGDGTAHGVAKDIEGCDDPNGESFSVPFDRKRRITSVTLLACEKLEGDSPAHCSTKVKDNPFTG